MKKLVFVFALFYSLTLISQKTGSEYHLDANYFYGSILRHNKDVAHLITAHPTGGVFSFNKKTFGEKRWQQAYNYPDYGVSFVYQNSHSNVLGNNYGIFGHYNFYFLNRNLLFRIAEGISYNTNPFDIDNNPKNNAYGSHLLTSSYLMLNYSKPNIFKGFGVQAGITLTHYSNASVKSPNTSTNSIVVNVGVTYEIESENPTPMIKTEDFEKFTQPIHFNFMVRGGVNESDILGLGQQPFYIFTAFADKRINFKSSLQLGTEVFFSKFLEKEIEYISVAFPNRGITGDEDYKRVGIFAGHEFHLNKVSIVGNLGYYVYYPYNYEGRVYLRAAVKYYFNKHIFTELSVKSHAANAEALELGIGFRL